jgi:thiol-disulfide isomerase/thioredoxin
MYYNMATTYHGKLLLISTIITIILILVMSRTTEKKQVKINTEHFDGTLVLFCYAHWCSHCKLIKPKFIELVKNQPIPNVKFEMVEESENKYKEYTQSIQGYPTLIVDDGKETKTFAGGNKVSEALERFLIYSR